MSGKTKGKTLSRTLFILMLGGVIEGCLSANPAPDIANTASLADDRNGVDDQLADLWASPWQGRAAGWNGGTALDVNTAIQSAPSNDPALRRNLAMVAGARANLSQASLPPNPVVNMAFGTAIDGMVGAPLFVQMIQQLTWLWTLSDRMDEGSALLEASIFDAAQLVGLWASTFGVFLVGAAMDDLGLSAVEAGGLLFAEIVTVGVISLAVSPFIRRYSASRLALMSAALGIAMQIASTYMDSFGCSFSFGSARA